MKTLEELKEHFSEIEFSPKYVEIIEKVQKDRCLLNIVGNAGAGKSTLLKILHYMLSEDNNVVVVSSTGTSSALLNSNSNICSTTLHASFGIKPQDIYGNFGKNDCGRKVIQLIENMDYLIIDEISMISADLFDYVMEMINLFKGLKTPKIILFGDILQLEPVIKTSDKQIVDYYEKKYNGNHYYFNSYAFRDWGFETVLLNKIYRQNGDDKFVEILNRIRVGEQTQSDLDFINSRVCSEGDWYAEHIAYLKVCMTNKEVESNNRQALETIDNPWIHLEADISGNFRNTTEYKSGLYPEDMLVKTDCQVMITRNAPRNEETNEREYVNGDIGILEYVSDDLSYARVRLSDDRVVDVQRAKTETYEYELENNVESNRVIVTPRVVGSYENIPIKPASSLTTHKCQGKTISCAYCDVGNWQANNSIYVMLSRFRKMEDFGLAKPIQMKNVKVSEEALKFIKKISSEEIVSESFSKSDDFTKDDFKVLFDFVKKGMSISVENGNLVLKKGENSIVVENGLNKESVTNLVENKIWN